MKRKFINIAAVILLAAFVFSGCRSSVLTLSADVLLEEGYFERLNEKDLALGDELKKEIKDKKFKFDSPPRVLIYHTHATEAYRMEGDYVYEPTEDSRTDDNTKNVVYAGEMLKEELEKRGFTVIHDTTNVEPPEFMSAYSRSLEVMESYKDIDIYIDLHRNAADVEKAKNDVVMIDRKRCARMFFVVGTAIGTYEGEYDKMPDWANNYAFASSVTNELNDIHPDLATDVRVKVGRHNQHVGLCLLAEVGHNANTLSDVINTLPHFADALKSVCEFKESK